MINEFIKSEAFDITSPRLIYQGSNSILLNTIDELKSGKISGIITAGINPGYTLPNSEEFLGTEFGWYTLYSPTTRDLMFSTLENQSDSITFEHSN